MLQENTADEIVAENIHLRDLVQRLAQRLQMARLEGFGGPEREKLLDEAREAIGESAHLRNSNAAALRKALEDTEELLEHFAKPGTMLHSAFFLHMRDNRAALAAPPRNCDRFRTADEARRAFKEAHSRAIVSSLFLATFEWLYANSEGKES